MSKKYDAGVKEYRDTYWTPDYVPLDTDLLACFKCTGQEGVPKEEVAAAVAAESSTGTWSTVWSELLTDLDFYIEEGAIPGGSRRNWESYGHNVGELSEKQRTLLCDPQTSGGLLVAVAPEAKQQVCDLLLERHRLGLPGPPGRRRRDACAHVYD